MAGEPCESIHEQAWWPFGGNVADQNSPSRVQLGLDLAEHPDSSRELWNVAVATPGEDEGVKAPRQLDGLDRARVELRRQTFLVEHVAGVGDSTRGDVQPLHPIAQLEQADPIAPCASRASGIDPVAASLLTPRWAHRVVNEVPIIRWPARSLISPHECGRFGARNGANEQSHAEVRGDDQSRRHVP